MLDTSRIKDRTALSDKIAISLSTLCAIHCLVLPFIVLMLPNLTILSSTGESFHFWIVFLIIPISLYAITMGCKKHKNYSLFFFVAVGLFFLLTAVALGAGTLGEFWEKTLTLIGALIIGIGHYKNYSVCRAKGDSACH